jgi:hypothetical protein
MGYIILRKGIEHAVSDMEDETYSHRQPSRYTNTPILSILSQVLIKGLYALRCWQRARTSKRRIDELLESGR